MLRNNTVLDSSQDTLKLKVQQRNVCEKPIDTRLYFKSGNLNNL